MCNCIDLVNQKLQDKNTKLGFTFPLFGGPTRVDLVTVKLDPQVRIKPVTMLPTYCPFCGQPYEKEDDHV